MDLKSCVQFLLSNGYAVAVPGAIVLTKKLHTELGLTGAVQPATTVIEAPVVSLPDDKKELWNKFIIDADIPHRVNAPGGGIYTVRQYSQANALKLARIIRTVDYNRLVESTKHYYKTVSYKALLSNYLDKDIWKHEYDAWGTTNVSAKEGENGWED